MRNKSITALLLATSICTLIPLNGLTANCAKNCADSAWSGGIGNASGDNGDCHKYWSYCYEDQYGFLVKNSGDKNGKRRMCSVRHKKDDSSVYVYNQSSTRVKVEVMGTAGESGTFPTSGDCWSVDYYLRKKGFSELRKTWYVPGKQARVIPQYIYEKGWSHAHVHFLTSGTYGLWSPDVSGWYKNADIK